MEDSDVDYHIDEDLEQIFHSDLQNIELGRNKENQDDLLGDHLPEWLVGVIVVIAMLIVAFFVMIITSLIKNRKKSRSSTYIGAESSTACDDLESGKIGHRDDNGMKITSFTSVSDAIADTSLLSQSTADRSDHDRLTPRGVNDMTGVQGCRNPLFVDDEVDSDENNDDNENVDKPKTGSNSNGQNIPSTSNGGSGFEANEHGKSKSGQQKYKQSGSGKKSSIKNEITDNAKASDSESDARKRLFSTKSKSGNSTSSKRDKNKTSLNENVISYSGESRKSRDDGKESGMAEKMETQKVKMPRDSHAEDQETGGCCEDSGIELGSSASRIKDENGCSSESDEIGSVVTKAGYDACTMGDPEGATDVSRSNECLNISQLTSLNSEDENPSYCGSEKSGFCDTPCWQRSPVDCSLESLTLTAGGIPAGEISADGVPSERSDVSGRILGCAERSANLLDEVPEKLGVADLGSQKDVGLTSILASGIPGAAATMTHSDPYCSQFNRTKDVEASPLSDNPTTHAAAASVSASSDRIAATTSERLPTMTAQNISECADKTEADKLLSTNL